MVGSLSAFAHRPLQENEWAFAEGCKVRIQETRITVDPLAEVTVSVSVPHEERPRTLRAYMPIEAMTAAQQNDFATPFSHSGAPYYPMEVVFHRTSVSGERKLSVSRMRKLPNMPVLHTTAYVTLAPGFVPTKVEFVTNVDSKQQPLPKVQMFDCEKPQGLPVMAQAL